MLIESMENRVLLAVSVSGGTLFISTNVAPTTNSVFDFFVSATGPNYRVVTSADGLNAIVDGTGIKGISITGSTGMDFVSVATNVTIPVTISTGLGNDIVDGGGGPTFAILGPATGSPDDDVFVGSIGADSVIGGAGNDLITGGSGDDTLLGGIGNDSLEGLDGNDSLVGDDSTTSTGGADSLVGDDGNDTLVGGNGAAADTIDGGIGRNVLSYADHTAAVLVIFGQSTNGGPLQGAGVGSIVTSGNPASTVPVWTEMDSIVDWDQISVVWGGSGADSIDATLADQIVELDGFAGNDSILGSNISDAFNPNVGDVIDGGDGQDVIDGEAGDDTLYGGLGADNVHGDVGNDLIYGGTGLQDRTTPDGDDLLFGEDGNDTLDGEAGNDLMSGGFGNDLLEGGLDVYFTIPSDVAGVPDQVVTSGSDTMQGDAGFDTVDYSARSNPVNVSIDLNINDGDPTANFPIGERDFVTETVEKVIGTVGNDTLSASATAVNAWLVGGAGNDSLTGGDGDDSLEGDAGNDTMDGGLGADSIDGGLGSNTVSYAGRIGGVFVSANDGVGDDGQTGEEDTVVNVSTIIGGAGDDTLVGSAPDTSMGITGNDCLVGGLGNDCLVGLAGNDTLIGGDYQAKTTLIGNTGADTFDGGDGTDVVDFSLIHSSLTITLDNVANDGISNGAQGADVMDNCEIVLGGSGSDTMTGSANGDCLVGNAGNDSLVGGAGDDTLVGGAGGDILLGGIGNDSLSGGDGQDILQGGDGDDSLLGGTGSDQMLGGAGIDWVSYNYETRAVKVTLDGIPNDGPAGESDLIGADVENIEGGHGNDTLVGNNAANVLSGGPGNDSIVGGKGNDTLRGEAGSDTLNGGWGNDVLIGGSGGDLFIGGQNIDTADYSDRTENLFLSLDNKANDGAKGEFDNIRSDVEILIGGSGNDSLVGDAAANTLIGNDGNDTLIGGYGADSLLGGNGNDLLVSSNRKLQNDLANDILDGGLGTDSVISDGSETLLNIP